jgi:hypothetical protein
MKSERWTEPELAMIERLAGEIPFPELVARVNNHARRTGRPVRTAKAIYCRLQKLGLRARARYGSTLTTGGVALALGISDDCVVKWLSGRKVREVLKPRRIGHFDYTTREDWRRLARTMPHVLGGFSADSLEVLLEDRTLAEQIATDHPLRPQDCLGIRCVETGRRWPNKSAASRELFISRGAISNSIRARRPVPALGLTFEALCAPRGAQAAP